MKATGIVRRVDDLGRIVIPKEIRRTLRIREGDPLEIYTDTDGGVIFKKYSPIGEMTSFATQYAEALTRTAGVPYVICDRDHVVAAAGVSRKEYLERRRQNRIKGYGFLYLVGFGCMAISLIFMALFYSLYNA